MQKSLEAAGAAQAPARLISVAAFGHAVGLSERSAWRALRRGDLPCVRIGSRTLVSLSDVDAFIASNRGLLSEASK